ncbi:hypothetical protein KMT30_15160 [Streptomyces sp. IBSBF 2953]|nr:hypothetical protein [Streptomyces hayashii]
MGEYTACARGTSHVRGVPPAPDGGHAVRVAVGAVVAASTGELTLYGFRASSAWVL